MGAGSPPDPMWPALVASMVPIVVGSVATYLRPFVESQADFRSRIRLRRAALLEHLAGRHTALLQHVRRITEADLLRGDGMQEPDLVGELTGETFRLFTVFHRLEMLKTLVRTAYTGLLVTVSLGIVGALIAWLWSDARAWVLSIAIVLACVQIAFIGFLYWSSCRLETYEDLV